MVSYLHMIMTPRTSSLIVEKHDGGYLAYFPALPGCHTWARSYEAAVNYAEDALSGYLETLARHGDRMASSSLM